MIKVGILDLKINNLYSLYNCFNNCGYKTKLVSNSLSKQNIDILVLPGVGSFKYAMQIAKNRNIKNEINEFLIKRNRFLYGICLGMQLFFDESEEFGKTNGFSLINGAVKSFKTNNANITTNIGWRKIKASRKNKSYSKYNSNYFYFVHSFFCKPKNKADVLFSTRINKNFSFCSAVKKNNILGTQFHPEKSGKQGIQFIKNLLKIYEKN